MDIESDDSERWEDFFGSSTNLAPSLIALYDTLTGSLDASQPIRSQSSETLKLNEEEEQEEEYFETSSKSSECSSRNSSATITGISPLLSAARETTSPARHWNNIPVLSPNVQRIISHSNTSIESLSSEALSGTSTYCNNNNNNGSHHRFVKKSSSSLSSSLSSSSISSTGVKHQVKLSNIPLSKGTCKLTQSGSDLVQTFDSSSEYLDSLVAETPSRLKKSFTPGPGLLLCTDSEKTPTNYEPFIFDRQLNKTNNKFTLSKQLPASPPPPLSTDLVKMEKVATTGQNNLRQNSKDFAVKPEDGTKEIIEAYNYTVCSLISSSVEQLSVDDDDNDHKDPRNRSPAENGDGTDLIEAINNYPMASSVQLVRSSSAISAATVASSTMLTYARAKILAAKANTLGGPVPATLPTAKQLEELEEASKISAESLDRLTDIKSRFSPKESRKMSCLMLPDIAKLKHRPLSSSSICSTSSSSSSGSDHLNGQRLTATSYLASVESLADQSENELMDPHSGMTVFERASMEIVDSERSYVGDLGQVIRGYLLDWKERACLRYDELRVLFSNIEEIYEFNSTLLKQLINSGMDPVKIAKCFIDLRERFDVYTTYCTSYPEAISLLTSLLQATHTNALLTSTQKMLQHTLPLGSYLLKPVQRILKYHLLLDNLRKHCDIKEVFQAHEIMRQVARNIDQVKKKLEQQSRVKELSGILDGWLGPELTVLGELRQEGLVMEHNKPRMVFLFATMLIITKPKEDNRLQFKSYIHQNNLMLSEHLPGEPTSFYVIPYDEPRNQIKLTARNRDQKRLWAQHIKGVILEKFDNIPNRAKELVYKLGDEEDRTPDKNTWKWSLHSTSTPVYLERRNQYRRSEMRNRSKIKRKTVTNSTSFEGFSEVSSAAASAAAATAAIAHKPLLRNHSMDDNMMPSLPKHTGSAVGSKKHENEKTSQPAECCAKAPDCNCIVRDEHTRRGAKSNGDGITLTRAIKERSKSVPRISFLAEDIDDDSMSLKGTLDSRKSKSTKSVEIKMYNTKTMPKRIATLKKNRSSKKETSKFYMDLNEFDEPTTVLKITESTENLIEVESATEMTEQQQSLIDADCGSDKLNGIDSVDNEINAMLSPSEKAKQDAEIVLDLLKNSKEFERIYKRSQKKKSFSNGLTVSSPEPDANLLDETPPRPPSRSPPPLDLGDATADADAEPTPAEFEPIYESLLRNVHVPYKFSPVLNRSKSQQYYKPREKAAIAAARPESDYVTLVNSTSGNLQQVGGDLVGGHLEGGTQLRSSDSKINYDSINPNRDSATSSTSTVCRDSNSTVVDCTLNTSSGSISQNCPSNMSTPAPEAIYARPIPKNLMKRLLSTNSNVSTSENSLLPRVRKSVENISLGFGRTNKPPERRVSDVSEMCRQSIIHRQGSEAVGERMAHVDYADPKTLFTTSMNDSIASLNLQRDSVFSLTSSSDSVCESKRSAAIELPTNFQYEDDVEACLENDFRDSAIYSDDNEKRHENGMSGGDDDYIKRPSSPPPPPPPARNSCYPQVPPKPTSIPSVKSPSKTVALTHEAMFCPSHLNSTASKSWVLQQIENFNK